MRTVWVVTFDALPEMLEHHLDRLYLREAGRDWTCETTDHDPVLYISMDRANDLDYCDEAADILRMTNRRPTLVAADVSGRHPGDEQVRAFVESLLTAFAGVAFDDYGGPWTLEEIRSGTLKKGHPFFDYQGWYDEYHRKGR
jgi:hypothetical protein